MPSPRFYTDFSPSFRTTIADAYWLLTVQYYGEHVNGDRKLGSLAGMLDLVTTLSPRFKQPYLFGAFALVDAGQAQKGYELLKKGAEVLPHDWDLLTTLGAYVITSTPPTRTRRAWPPGGTRRRRPCPAARPGCRGWRRICSPRAARPRRRPCCGRRSTGQGDRYSQQKAVAALDRILPTQKEARMQAVARLAQVLTRAQLDSLVAALFKGY